MLTLLSAAVYSILGSRESPVQPSCVFLFSWVVYSSSAQRNIRFSWVVYSIFSSKDSPIRLVSVYYLQLKGSRQFSWVVYSILSSKESPIQLIWGCGDRDLAAIGGWLHMWRLRAAAQWPDKKNPSDSCIGDDRLAEISLVARADSPHKCWAKR